MLAVVLVACALAWGRLQPAAGFSPPGVSPYERAAAALQEGDAAAAIALLQDLVIQSPRDTKALTLLGMALAASGKSDEADRVFKSALAADPHYAPALKNLAILELSAGRASEARAHFAELLKLAPADPVAHLGLAEIDFAAGQHRAAADHYARSQGLYARDPASVLRYANASIEVNDRATAAKLLRSIPDSAPAAVHLDAGVLWARLGEYAAAVPQFEAARAGHTDAYRAGFNLALAYLKTGRSADAAKTAEELIASGHRTAELQNLLGLAYETSGRTKEAYEALRTATRIAPDDETNYLDLVALCIKHGNVDLALEIAEIGVKRLPRSTRLQLERGIVFAVRGDLPEARQSFETTLAMAPDTPLVHAALGLVLMQMDRAPEAVETLRRRVRASRDDYLALWFLGEALSRAGAAPGSSQEAEAVEALDGAVELKPDLPDTHALLGKLLFRRGELDRAAAHLEQALKLEPDNVAAMYALAQVYGRKSDPRAKELFARVGKIRQEERDRFAKTGLAQIVREGAR